MASLLDCSRSSPSPLIPLNPNWYSIIFESTEKGNPPPPGTRLGVSYLVASAPLRSIPLPIERLAPHLPPPPSFSLPVIQSLTSDSSADSSSSLSRFVGSVVWDAAALLCNFLFLHPSLVCGQTVLDLGTGTGLCGVVASLCGSPHSVLTDIEVLGSLVSLNVSGAVSKLGEWSSELSSSDAASGLAWQAVAAGMSRRLAALTYGVYWWGGGLPPGISPGEGGLHFDVVIASDDLYCDDAFPPLLATLKAITGPDTMVIFSYKRRMNRREIPFFEKLAEFLTLLVVEKEGLDGSKVEFGETYIILAALTGGEKEKELRSGGGKFKCS